MKRDQEKLVLEWLEKIQRQAESGKSIAAWCREQAISYSTFLYWHKKLKPIKVPFQPNSFIELPEETSGGWIKIILEGAKIEITRNFDRGALLFCLRVFGGH